MFIRSNTLSTIYKVILIGFVVYGVAAAVSASGASSLRYFTIQSNILAGGVTLYLLVDRLTASRSPRGSGRAPAYLRGLTMLAISVTGIVFHVMLAPGLDEPIGFMSHILHTLVPIGFVLDWLLFARKGSFRFRDIPVWVIYPLAYLAINLAVATSDGFYPYPFMDAGEIGYGMVTVNALALLVGFSVLGVVYVLVDRFLARRARKALRDKP